MISQIFIIDKFTILGQYTRYVDKYIRSFRDGELIRMNKTFYILRTSRYTLPFLNTLIEIELGR